MAMLQKGSSRPVNQCTSWNAHLHVQFQWWVLSVFPAYVVRLSVHFFSCMSLIICLLTGVLWLPAEYFTLELDHFGSWRGGAAGAKRLSVHSHPTGPGKTSLCGHVLPASSQGLHLWNIPNSRSAKRTQTTKLLQSLDWQCQNSFVFIVFMNESLLKN